MKARLVFLMIAVYFFAGTAVAYPSPRILHATKNTVFFIAAYQYINLKHPQRSKVKIGSSVAVTRHLLATNCHIVRKAKLIRVKVRYHWHTAYLVAANY